MHINGRANHLDAKDISNNKLRLTLKAYNERSTFSLSNWYGVFATDLEQAAAILFVGYSLYDREITDLLKGGNSKDRQEAKYKNKTFFVVAPSEKPNVIYKLEQYGAVLKIGSANFGKTMGRYDRSKAPLIFIALQRYSLNAAKAGDDISDKNILRFMTIGDIAQKYVDAHINGNARKCYLIRRTMLEACVNKVKDGKSVIITGTMGTGKSVFLKEMASELSRAGCSVYVADDNASARELQGEFDRLLNARSQDPAAGHLVIVADGYARHADFIDYIAKYQTDVSLVATERNSEIVRFETSYSAFVNELVNISDMTDTEINDMSNIITGLAYWDKNLIGQSDRQIHYLSDDCKRNICSVLVSVFDAPQIKKRFQDALLPLLENDANKKMILGICVLAIIGVPVTDANIADIAGNDMIYQSALFRNDGFVDTFVPRGNKIVVNAPLALALVDVLFDSAAIKNFLLDVAERFNNVSRSGYDVRNDVFKQIRRFSVVERMLHERKDMETTISDFYDSLKGRVPWLVREPHFWLQYAMAKMMFGDLKTAEQYMDTAYGYADRKFEGYDKKALDLQSAHLLIMKAMRASNSEVIINLFMQTHNKILDLPNDEYKFRQLDMYKELWDKKESFLSFKNKRQFVSCCSRMLECIQHNTLDKGRLFQKCQQFLNEMVNGMERLEQASSKKI